MKFKLNTNNPFKNITPNFGYNGFGELVYYRTYSRLRDDGTQESWPDTVLRVINGVIGIRKQHCIENRLPWDEKKYQEYGLDMSRSLFRMEWMPPGRGLWSMGTKLIEERGAMPLYNCAFTTLDKDWVNDLSWLMDLLMNGVGVGFKPIRESLQLYTPEQPDFDNSYVIEDSREGWVNSVNRLLRSYTEGAPLPNFNYNFIRNAGQPLKTFGGTASGPGPLIQLHNRIRGLCEMNLFGDIDSITFKTDLANVIGCCVVAGNIRRSAEIALGDMHDPVFADLKNYDLYPHREEFGWMSNNSIQLTKSEDFDQLGEIASRVLRNGEPGYMNMLNVPFGRLNGEKCVLDKAIGVNPCGEIPLENKEVCNLACTCPTRCSGEREWLRACDYANFYASTVALLPTHQPETNAVIARNRRIGIDIIDFAGWKEQISTHRLIRCLRDGYKLIKERNRELANEAGVRPSIRLTTIKPGGTVSKLVGRTPGASHPTATYMIRRIRVQKGTPLDGLMQEANIPFEPCFSQPEYTNVFEYPIFTDSVRPVSDVSLWEQANNVILLQREWADNSVSNTLYFQEHEINDIERVLSSIAPVTKSVSMMPVSTGSYEQMPEEEITRDEYEDRLSSIRQIDWSRFRGDGQDEKYCDSEACVI